jgi:site-specific recombinase XerD
MQLAVDFDAALHSYTSPWMGPEVIPDPPVEGGIEGLNQIVKRLDVVVFTTRSRTELGRQAVRAWLLDDGCENTENSENIIITSERLPAWTAYLANSAADSTLLGHASITTTQRYTTLCRKQGADAVPHLPA